MDDRPGKGAGTGRIAWWVYGVGLLALLGGFFRLTAPPSPSGAVKPDVVPSAKPTTKPTASGVVEAPMTTTAGSGSIAAPPSVAAPPPDALRTASGLSYKFLNKVSGAAEHPTDESKVTVHYTGWTTDGKMVDSSVTRGAPATFPVTAVIKGWSEGVKLMAVGERARFWIPESLAYGGGPGKPAGMLVFDIEMLEIKSPIPAPPDVAKVPTDAKVQPSGLATKILKAGTGAVHPGPKSEVEVHYTGWTTDGKMFDSSIARGEAVRFGLDMVIKGWTEALQLMVKGEKRRIWIPEALAYAGAPGAPAGMLVFEVELLDIVTP